MDAKKKRECSCSWLPSLPFLLLLTWNIIPTSMASDSISLGRSISGTQTIVSKEGNFALGFFTPGNSKNYYIGIWYNKLPGRTVVWVANRAAPVASPAGAELRIAEDGNLVLLNSSKASVWSSNSSRSASSRATSAVLLDTGNLVLRNASATVWQSFDHPTDTWMPGGWLGVNKVTGEYQSITSWENPENPAPGPFAQSMDPDGTNQYVMLYDASKRYWSSGLWNGEFFTGVPGTRESTVFNFTFSDGPDRKFAMYTILDTKFITRYVMDSSGQGKQWYWFNDTQEWQPVFTQPLDHCDVYSLCGSFGVCNQKSSELCQCPVGFVATAAQEWKLNDWNSGCARRTSLQCRSTISSGGKEDGFLKMEGMRLPANPQSLKAGSAGECRAACLNNCSCHAYSYDTQCSIWHGDLRNLQQLGAGDTGGATLYLRLAWSDLPSGSSSHKAVIIGATLGAAAGVVLIMAALFGVAWARRRWQRARMAKQSQNSVIQFTYGDMKRATKNFSDKLGGGGFGSVYKGSLPDKSEVAVKKFEGLRQGEKQFRAEVSTLGAIQHVNLVRLRGFCCEGSNRLLVYEYMSGGSLDYHLFRNTTTALDWKTRYSIILGVARGLAYLHEQCRECIIHCDIKPDNILLDADFSAKVADFGMAKLIGHDFSKVLTTMRGTIGYLAPEWISGLPISTKVDVYSFGMMLFEVVSGDRNSVHSGSKSFFPSWAATNLIQGNTLGLLDGRLNNAADAEEVTRVCRIACWCIQDHESSRPTMGQIVQILEGAAEVNSPPFPATLKHLKTEEGSRIMYELQTSGEKGEFRSQEDASFTSSLVHGR